MKIIVERKYKKTDYTIGVMTIEGKDFRCNTLEAPILSFGHPSPVNGEGGLAQYGPFAIGKGRYWVTMWMSHKFKSYRPLLCGVKGRSGILIHEGNTVKDTLGCILVGENTRKGMVLNSRATLKRLMDLIWAAEDDHEPVSIEIRE